MKVRLDYLEWRGRFSLACESEVWNMQSKVNKLPSS